MKAKNLLLLFVMTMFTMTFISCNEDEDDEDMLNIPSELIGTWRLTQEDGNYTQDLTYRADGTGRQVEVRGGETIFQSDYTFVVTGNSIVIKFTDPVADANADYPQITYSVSADGQTLSLTFTYPGQSPFTNDHVKI